MKNYAGLGLAVSLFVTIPALVRAQADTLDWPMYNHDVLGIRHNPGEKTISKANAGQLVEKWRFPAKASGELVGVIHATPIVVDGYVYFGTATDPAFYKLTPDGKLRWSYRNPAYGTVAPVNRQTDEKTLNARFQTSPNGILASALVTDETVFFGDIGGWFHPVVRAT